MSAATNQNFSMHSGDTQHLAFTVTNLPVGMTLQDVGVEIRWSCAPSVAEEELLTKSIGSGIAVTALNTFLVSLEPADTEEIEGGAYYHEAEVIFANGAKKTVAIGTMTVVRDLIESA